MEGGVVEELREAYEDLLDRAGLNSAFDDHGPDAALPFNPTTGQIDRQTMERYVRSLKSVRKYATFADVGTEPPVNYFERLAIVAADKGPYLGERLPQLQQIIEAELVELRRWVAAAGLEWPSRTYVGVFPTGDLNAHARPVGSGGALILLNSGLMELVFQVLKLQVAANRVFGEPLLTRDQSVLLLAEVVNAYLFGQHAAVVRPWPPLPKPRAAYAEGLTRWCEQFVLAHEIGHLAAGHLEHPRMALQSTSPVGPLEVVLKGWDQEFEADEIAVGIMRSRLAEIEAKRQWPRRGIRRRASRSDDGTAEEADAQLLAAGIYVFYGIADVVELFDARLERRPRLMRETHPPVGQRSDRVRAVLQQTFPGPQVMDLADGLIAWLFDLLEPVAAVFDRLDEMMVRQGRWS